MIFLIDGFNLIYKFPDLEEMMYRGNLNDARSGLLEKLREYQRIKKARLRVVFDGKKLPSSSVRSEKVGTIDVYYSLQYSADFLIKEFIKKDPNPRMSTVVTSDKDIQFFVNRFRARVMTSEKFAEMLNAAVEEFYNQEKPEKEEEPEISSEEVSFWEKMFRKKRG